MSEFVDLVYWASLAYLTLEGIACLGRIIKRATDEVIDDE